MTEQSCLTYLCNKFLFCIMNSKPIIHVVKGSQLVKSLPNTDEAFMWFYCCLQGRGSLVGCRVWGHTEPDTTEVT